jgi:hypothetical protein
MKPVQAADVGDTDDCNPRYDSTCVMKPARAADVWDSRSNDAPVMKPARAADVWDLLEWRQVSNDPLA